MIDIRTCNYSLVIPQKPEVEEVFPLGQCLVTLHFTTVSAEQNLHILRCTKVLPNKSLMFSQTLLPYIISGLSDVASVTPTSYVRAHVLLLIAGYFFYHGATVPSGPRLPHYRRFMIILRHTTIGKTPLDEWSARHRDLHLTTHNTRDKHSCPRRDSKPQFQQARGRRPTP
jgi:hypothetical protein